MSKILFSTILIFLFICCEESITNSNEFQSNIEIREDLSASEFKEAIIGMWGNQLIIQDKANIEELDLSRSGTARIIIVENNVRKVLIGEYFVTFMRPPELGSVTLAEITIKNSKETIVLSRVNFGFLNIVSSEEHLLIIEREPYGVMKKREFEPWDLF